METLISVVVGFGAILFIGLKSYAESCLPWKHPLNLILNGHPTKQNTRKTGLIDNSGDNGIGDSCSGD